MKKIVLAFILLSVAEASFSQDEKKQFIHKGLLRAMATIAPGYMLKESISTISIHGALEYYVADNISIRGDSYYFLNSNQLMPESGFPINYSILNYNHATFSGVSCHLRTRNHFDPYFYFQPGISITNATTCLSIAPFNGCGSSVEKTTANPLISFGTGFNFYFQRWFHLFGEARYVTGKYLSDAPTPMSLNELRFSFGLGFNLSVLKPKS